MLRPIQYSNSPIGRVLYYFRMLVYRWKVMRYGGDKEPMETAILETTIIKLGSLLALGFGEAGVNIVVHNMATGSHGVNAMVPGQRVECIVGLARIQNFSVA